MTGGPFYYWVNDSRSGSVVYRMHVREHEAQRLVIASENASPVRALLITLFEPGVLQTVEFFERKGPDVWEYYFLTRVDHRASIFADGHDASYINRAVARYRRVAGIPRGRTEPAAGKAPSGARRIKIRTCRSPVSGLVKNDRRCPRSHNNSTCAP